MSNDEALCGELEPQAGDVTGIRCERPAGHLGEHIAFAPVTWENPQP